MGDFQCISASIAILVDGMTAPFIKENGILIEGRVQYITLHLPDNSKLTIINAYAPRASRDKSPLWKRISKAEFTANHVILSGDFNHLEEVDCRGKAWERWMHRREAPSWHHLTLQYGLMDTWTFDSFKKMTKKDYTYDNGRVGPGLAIFKIDKFLVSHELESKGGRIEAAPSIRRISDHSPLVMTIWGHTSAPHTTAPYFDTSLLREEESKIALLEAWEGTEPPPSHDTEWLGWLEAATHRVLKCNTRLAKEKKCTKGARTKAFQQKICLAEIQLQRHPRDEAVKNIFSVAQGHLADSLQEHVARNH